MKGIFFKNFSRSSSDLLDPFHVTGNAGVDGRHSPEGTAADTRRNDADLREFANASALVGVGHQRSPTVSLQIIKKKHYSSSTAT